MAALGVEQLKKLKLFNKKRNIIAKKYDKFLSSFPQYFEVQKLDSKFTHSYQMYTCLVKNNLRDDLVLYLRSKSIEASVHFDPPLHKQKYCKNFAKDVLPNTELLSKTIMSLPIYPSLNDKQIKFIFDNIKKWIKKNSTR